VTEGDPGPVVAPSPLAATMGAAGIWLLVHAFASGCTATTWIEAVSNGVPSFPEPANLGLSFWMRWSRRQCWW
jgi:hypothetical protein